MVMMIVVVVVVITIIIIIVVIIIIIIITIIIIIALIGSIRDFFLQSPLFAANCLAQVRLSGQGEVVCKSLATHHVMCHVVLRESSAIKFDGVESHLF